MDWQGVLSGQPLQWIISSSFATLWVTLAGIVLAMLIVISLLGLHLTGNRLVRAMVEVWVSVSRNTPLLVQLMFWYFAAWNWLPRDVISFINADRPWSILPDDIWWLTPEFICSVWGLGVFTSTFLVEEIASGLQAVSTGQREAVVAQRFSSWAIFRHILLPQGLANAWQPIVEQYLSLLKLSSLASDIGLAELTYQVWRIESYNVHALEAFAVGTALYLFIDIVLGTLLTRFGPQSASGKSSKIGMRIFSVRSILHDR